MARGGRHDRLTEELEDFSQICFAQTRAPSDTTSTNRLTHECLDPLKFDKTTRHGFVNDRVNVARYEKAAVGQLYSAKANNIAPSSTSAPVQADPTSFPSSIAFASATEELAEVCWATPGTC